MMRNVLCAALAIAGAALLMLAALDWVGYTRFLVSMAAR
jgi:hypothetical protein